jgi:hypothetical protein
MSGRHEALQMRQAGLAFGLACADPPKTLIFVFFTGLGLRKAAIACRQLGRLTLGQSPFTQGNLPQHTQQVLYLELGAILNLQYGEGIPNPLN